MGKNYHQILNTINQLQAETANNIDGNKNPIPQRPIDKVRKFKAKLGTRVRKAFGFGPNIPNR